MTEPQRRKNASALRPILAYGSAAGGMGLVTLFAIPVVVAQFGPTAWGSIAVGQAIGTGLAVIVAFGWNTTGPPLVAKADQPGRMLLYAQSLKVQLAIAGPAIVAAVGLCYLIAPAYQLVSAVAAVGLLLTGVMANWYFTGAGKPMSVLLLDAVPRIVGTVVGALALIAGGDLLLLPVAQLVGVAAAIVFSTVAIAPLSELRLLASMERLRILIPRQSHGVLIALVTAAYISLPISVVATVAPSALAPFALVDKLLRFSTTALSPILQYLQGWVPRADRTVTLHRVRAAFGVAIAVAVVSGLAFVFLAPWLSKLLSHGQITPSAELGLAFGVLLGVLVLSQIVGLVCLLALDRGRALATFATIGALVGVPAVIAGALFYGAEGAAWALVIAESTALFLEAWLLIALLNRDRGRSRGAEDNVG